MRLKFPLLVLAAAAAAALALLSGGGPAAVSASSAPEMQLATALDEPFGGVTGTSRGACQTSWRPGTAGVVGREVSIPAGIRYVEVALGGAKGDWDVAVFDATGTAIAASAEPDARESASGWTAVGGVMRVQACRLSGKAAAVPVALASAAPVGDAAAAAANPPQLITVRTPTKADKDRLLALGLDMTEHAGANSVGVVLYTADERAALRRAGFTWDVLVGDMVLADLKARLTEQRTMRTRAAADPVLPSGRTGTYRTLADYNAEMKMLAEKNPNLVKLFKMPNKTFLGKDVMGIEIAKNVDAKDGRPAFFNMGVHHAREWPAGEMPMEWAYELINGFKKGDARATKIVEQSRNIIVPIVNPDGFEASRTAGQLSPTNMGAGQPEDVDDTVYLVSGAATGGEYRRKNCRVGDSETGNCATSAGLAEPGTDPNRNYGQFWGGPGADTNPATQTYRGPGPFSEPETRNIKSVVSNNQVMTLITNHTTAGLVLRAPGLAVIGDPVDENKGYKALGDAMAKENGYLSQKGFELYDTTGTTEDWSYNATGGYGFTFEIYCGSLNYATGDCDDPAFHPTFATGVEKEWNGTNDTADHTKDPAGKYDGKGNREAYYIAAESTINEARHSIIEGTAPAGATLRLTKDFKTETFTAGTEKPKTTDDKLETVYKVGDDGKYVWHVNPSTRPIVAKDRGKMNAGMASPEEVTTGGPNGSSETADDPDDGAAMPDPANDPNPPTGNYNDHPFAIPTTGDNATLSIAVTWSTPTTDWDVKLYEDTDGDGKSDPAKDKEVGTAATGTGNVENLSLPITEAMKGKKYVLRVINYAAVEPYKVTKTYVAPMPFVAGKKEKWTLTCEFDGKTLQTEQVLVERGERATVNLTSCGGAAPTPPVQCKATKGFKSVAVKPRDDGGALLDFEKLAGVSNPVRIDIFKPGTATKVLNTRKVQRFDATDEPIVWDGTDKKGDPAGPGYYFVRFLVKKAAGVDVRRIALQRSNGKFLVLKDFDRRDTCTALRQFKLSGPVFGGSGDKPLTVNFRLGAAADIEGTISRNGKAVGSFKRTGVTAGQAVSIRQKPKGLAKGDYTVSLRVIPSAGGQPLTATAVSRRI